MRDHHLHADDPAGVGAVFLRPPVPGEPDFDAAIFVRVDFLALGAGDEGDLGAVDFGMRGQAVRRVWDAAGQSGECVLIFDRAVIGFKLVIDCGLDDQGSVKCSSKKFDRFAKFWGGSLQPEEIVFGIVDCGVISTLSCSPPYLAFTGVTSSEISGVKGIYLIRHSLIVVKIMGPRLPIFTHFFSLI
jgi:hypothetical protein